MIRFQFIEREDIYFSRHVWTHLYKVATYIYFVITFA